jgi:hypothetical protein
VRDRGDAWVVFLKPNVAGFNFDERYRAAVFHDDVRFKTLGLPVSPKNCGP